MAGPRIKLSDHFTLAEMTATSATHLDNTPPPEIVEKLRHLCQVVLEPIRARFGIVLVHSGYRSPAVNEFDHGVSDSQHMRGEAADIKTPQANLFDVARWIVSDEDFDQLILEFIDPTGLKSGWLHVSWVADRPLRKQILVASRNAEGKTQYEQIGYEDIPEPVKVA